MFKYFGYLLLPLLAAQDGQIRTLSKTYCHQAAWSPDGKWIACVIKGENLGSVALWDVKAGKIQRSIGLGNQELVALDFSPDSKLLATGELVMHRVRLWDVATAKLHKELTAPEASEKYCFRCVKFSRDGKVIVSGGDDRLIPVWDVNDGKHLKTLHTSDSAEDLAISPDSKTVAYSMPGTGMRMWSIENDQELAVLQTPSTGGTGGEGKRLAFSPTQYLLALATSSHEKKNGEDLFERRIEMWDFQKKSLLYCLRFPSRKSLFSQAIAFSPDGESFAGVNDEGRPAVWSVSTQKEIKDFPIEDVRQVIFSPDGKTLLVAAKGGVSLCPLKPKASK
jgi:WD40 repeat protein